MKLAICGAGGRMGLTVARLAIEEGVAIVGAIDSPTSSSLGRDIGELAGAGNAGVVVGSDVGAGLLGADVVIDFSSTAATNALARAAMNAKVAIVSGTTMLDNAAQRALLDLAPAVVPVLWSPNMSVGVQVLAELVTQAIRKLGADFDVEIVETHHKAKVDSPSGTALRLVAAAKEARNDILEEVRGRDGRVGPREKGQIGVFAMRGGDVIGDHSVHLFGPGERIELTHRATSRELFARGALRAARFLAGKPAGRYSIADVVG